MTEIVDQYVATIQAVLVIAVPVLALLTLFSWYEAWRLWPLRVPLVLALSNSVVGCAATWLAWTILYREQVGPLPPEWLPVTATAILILALVPWMTTAYLAYLEATRDDDR